MIIITIRGVGVEDENQTACRFENPIFLNNFLDS